MIETQGLKEDEAVMRDMDLDSSDHLDHSSVKYTINSAKEYNLDISDLAEDKLEVGVDRKGLL